MNEKPVVVIGNGWAALGSVVLLLREGKSVVWITGLRPRILPPLLGLELGFQLQGARLWKEMADFLEIPIQPFISGSHLQEYRNKAFREPLWNKAPTTTSRIEVLEECLHPIELGLMSVYEGRIPEWSLGELDSEIRKNLLSSRYLTKLFIIDNEWVERIQLDKNNIQSITLSSKRAIICHRIFYADHWQQLSHWQGLPKPPRLPKKRNQIGLVQLIFSHLHPFDPVWNTGYSIPLHKDAAENDHKHVIGYFFAKGKNSCWSTCLDEKEVEDNHLIAKKIRKMKNALSKGFPGIIETVKEEQLFFHEGLFIHFTTSEWVQFQETEKGFYPHPTIHGLTLLTDSCGPASALHHVGISLNLIHPKGADTQSESLNFGKASMNKHLSS